MPVESDEVRLLELIQQSPPGPQRNALIIQLDQAPVHMRTFYERWLFVHDVMPFWDCWSDEGYDPSQSKWSRNVQLLAAADYGKSGIDNGGFHQFFSNCTGVFAPEMVEWLERAGLERSSNTVREAIAVFGPQFPRSQAARRRFLARFKGDGREEWDPFCELDDRFYAHANDDAFDKAANKWLREVCGVTSLLQES